MADRAMADAVGSLLGVIRSEARLLRGVRDDVQFIKEEMESMNSFLLHLARTVFPRGEDDEKAMVRTWMNQVRLLSQDCNNCIDLYLYRGNPEIHLAKDGLWRYLLWVPWFLRKMVAQYHTATQLAALKERARQVGERRLRYGVEVPANEKAVVVQWTTAPLSSAAPSPAEDDEEDGDNQEVIMATNRSGRRSRAFFEFATLDDYFKGKLADWMKKVQGGNTGAAAGSIPSIAIVAPPAEDAFALANEALLDVAKTHFQCSVLVDIPAVHISYRSLQPQDILYYILGELERAKSGQGEEVELQSNDWRDAYRTKREILWKKRDLIDEIQGNIKEMKVDDKIEKIKSVIPQVEGDQLKQDVEQTDGQLDQEALGALLVLLKTAAAAVAEHDHTLELYDDIIQKASKKLKQHMEKVVVVVVEEEEEEEEEEEACAKQQPAPIRLHDAQYQHILREVFQTTSNSKPLQAQEQDTKQATKTTTTTLGDDPIEELKMIHGAREDKKNATIEETIKKIEKIRSKIKEQLVIKGIVDKINKHHLKHERTLIILKIDQSYVFGWEETRNALSLLGCVAGAVIVTASKNTKRVKEYCYPLQEPMDYSLVGLYYDTVLEHTGHQMHEDNNYDPQIYRAILDKCEPQEFCMKIFAHALYANPKMSKQELSKLHSTLQISPKSSGRITKKMLMFSYNNLPKEYKSCLLYLAIFPRGHKIRRSTLIGRWVVEGLITTTEDWHWSSSVHQADRCFDALIDRWLVYPADIGATGKVKSCIVGDLIHKFITKIAKEQCIVETRLSHHLARHFSIFNNVHLRASDTIRTFFRKINEPSQLPQFKVLDLEGCYCFKTSRHALKDICNKILLLKYLSLRGTDVTQLPSAINNLHDLEVLDIRQTKLPASATRDVVLLKLKRLLAGHIDLAIEDDKFSSVWIPERIDKMQNMEVMSNVKPRNSKKLKVIGQFWQLRKLGVVIDDKDSHFLNLFRTISDLHMCLQSLSITLPTSRFVGTPSIGEFQDDMHSCLIYSPKLLESLSISGTTERGALLPLLVKDDGCNQLNKVTLTRTRLNQNDLLILAKLPKLCCVRLQNITCTERNLTFKKDKFQNLKYFLVEGSKSNLTGITFEIEAAPELEKIVLSLTDNLESLSGVENLPKLEEIELKNNSRLLSFFGKAKQIAKVTLTQGDLQILTKKTSEDSYEESKLTFKESEFPKLSLLIVDCSVITSINFANGSAPMLKKIAWSFTNMESLSGIDKLPRLKELELIGDPVPNEVEEEIRKHEHIYYFKHRKPEN